MDYIARRRAAAPGCHAMAVVGALGVGILDRWANHQWGPTSAPMSLGGTGTEVCSCLERCGIGDRGMVATTVAVARFALMRASGWAITVKQMWV